MKDDQFTDGEVITPEGSVVEIYLTPLTDRQISEHQHLAERQRKLDEKSELTAKNRFSASEKLKYLGLTLDEISAVLG